MATILGKGLDDALFRNLVVQNGIERQMGYLIFELANLESFDRIKDRLQRLQNGREKVAGTDGMGKKDKLLIDSEVLLDYLTGLWDRLTNNYAHNVSARRNLLEASGWQPQAIDAFAYFKHHLKLFAEKLIDQAGE
jgi:hypothetical protein